MKKIALLIVVAATMALMGLATAGLAAPPEGGPPGQGECGHGNSQKPCKEDPQPDKGKDCEEHGNHGGVNEDHCKGDPVDPPCTANCNPIIDPPVDPPKEEETTSTPTETNPVTPEPPVSPESELPSAPETPVAPSAEEPTFEEQLEQQAQKQAKANGASTSEPSASGGSTPMATDALPHTGLPLGLVALLGAALSGAGLWLRRR